MTRGKDLGNVGSLFISEFLDGDFNEGRSQAEDQSENEDLLEHFSKSILFVVFFFFFF